MLKIDPYEDTVAELQCSAIGCEDTLIITVDNCRPAGDNDFFVALRIKYTEPVNLWQRIRKAWRYVRGWGQLDISYDSIFLTGKQALRLSEILEDAITTSDPKFIKAMRNL